MINSSFDKPDGIDFKIEIVIVLLAFFSPFLGHTYPEFIATGWHETFSCSYILEAPFLNGGLSSGRTLVPWGNIIKGLLDLEISFNSRYLIDVASQLDGEKVEIFFNDTGSPALIKDPGDFDSIFVVMPMKG